MPTEKTPLLTEMEKYAQLFKSYPSLSRFWDEENQVPLISDLMSSRNLSSGENILRQCLVSIWRGNGTTCEIDFTDLATLPQEDKKPLLLWIYNPFWP